MDETQQTASAFYPQMDEDAARLKHLAKTAAALSGDDSVSQSAEQVIQRAQENKRFFTDTAQQIDKLVDGVQARVAAIAKEHAATDAAEEAAQAEAQELLAQLTQADQELRQAEADVRDALIQEERRVRTILSEHDHIRRLLQGAGSATDKQFDVMAFPRNANAKTNVLQISGGAGTGKTLCLLAKLIQDTSASRQMGLLPERQRHGLFVCFNTALRAHVSALLARMPHAADNIEVVSYDQFVNQLVRANPAEEFAHLASFASRSRYEPTAQGMPGQFWKLIYEADIHGAIASAMGQVAAKHPDQAQEYYLFTGDPANVEWVSDEIAWLEARYQGPEEARALYPDASRVGRGVRRRPSADIRRVILEIWTAFQDILIAQGQYTIEQATKRLLTDPDLPTYDAIAIDEVQDLTLSSVKLLVRMRADEQSRVYICGDENQKIYKRDLTWAELDEDIHGRTIELEDNKRNSAAIEAFADRLLGRPTEKERASDLVFVGEWSEESIMGLIESISQACPEETTAVISGNTQPWFKRARERGIEIGNPRDGGVLDRGLYIIGHLGGKGLEFDNVIVDCASLHEAEEAMLKNILYVNCTRARKRLYVRYVGEPPDLLRRFYPDFL